MAGLPFTLTTAGLALANPANTGTNAIIIDRIGVSAVAIPGDPGDNLGLLQLPNELKRLATFAGVVAGDDVIHVTVRDESPDVYQLRTFGLYSAQGVLLAYYSQATPIMEKAAASMLLLAADLQFTTPIAAELVFGDTNFINPPATTAMPGVVELATSAETQAGTDAQRAVTPLGLKATLQAWAANFAAAVHGHAIADIVGLAAALAGKSPTGHKHDAADVETGTLDVARIPTLALAKISGLVEALAGKAAAAHSHDAGDTVTGVFAVARIPSLAMSKITGLVDALAGKAAADHQHDASALVTGVLNVLRIPDLAIAKITGLAAALALKADLAGAAFTGVVRVKRNEAAGAVEITSSSSQYRPGLVSFHTPDGTRRGYVGYASSDAGGELLIQGESGWSWKFSSRPMFGDAVPWDSANFDPSPLAFFVPRTGAFSRHQTPHGWIDIGPANPEFAHLYTDRPSFYFNKPILVNGAEVWTASTFNPANFNGGTINGGAGGLTVAGGGGLIVGGSGGVSVQGSGGLTTTKFTASGASLIENNGNIAVGSWAGGVLLTLSNFHPTLAFNDRSSTQFGGAIAYDGGAFTFRYDADGSGQYATSGAVLDLAQPTAPVGNNSNRLATTAFVQQEITARAPGASTYTAGGLIEMATNAEAIAGTDQTRAINPYVLKLRIEAAIADDALALYWPAGELHLYAKASPPAGVRVLVAEGQAVSRTTYARLFAEIGTTFGAGNGTSTFNLPDWRGVFFRGLDRARGLDPNRQLGVYQASQNLRHNHTIPSRSNPDAGNLYVEDAGSGGSLYSPSTGYEGGDEARPVNEALLACISY